MVTLAFSVPSIGKWPIVTSTLGACVGIRRAEFGRALSVLPRTLLFIWEVGVGLFAVWVFKAFSRERTLLVSMPRKKAKITKAATR